MPMLLVAEVAASRKTTAVPGQSGEHCDTLSAEVAKIGLHGSRPSHWRAAMAKPIPLSRSSREGRFLFLVCLAVIAAPSWNRREETLGTLRSAETVPLTHGKNQVCGRLEAMPGGVSTPICEHTLSNPYCAHSRNRDHL